MFEPVLEAVDVAVGRRLSGAAVTIREVAVEPVGRRLRLSDDGGRHRHDDQAPAPPRTQVHERDREAARQAGPLEPAHDRIEQQRDQRRDQEQEDDVTRRGRRSPTPAPAEWAGRRAESSAEPRCAGGARPCSQRRCYRQGGTRFALPTGTGRSPLDGALALKAPEPCATVPSMSPPAPNRRARRTRKPPPRPRAAPPPARRAGRPARGGPRRRSSCRPSAARARPPRRRRLRRAPSRLLPGRPAAAGDRRAPRRAAPPAAGQPVPRDRDRLPGRQRRRARAVAGRHAGERGAPEARGALDRRRLVRAPALVPAAGRPRPGLVVGRRRRARRHRRLLAGRRNDRRDRRRRAQRPASTARGSTSSRRARRRSSSPSRTSASIRRSSSARR